MANPDYLYLQATPCREIISYGGHANTRIEHRLNSKFYTQYQRIGGRQCFKCAGSLPKEVKMGTVRFETGDDDFCWWFATNREKDLKLASNLELINKVKKSIGAKGAPQWYELDD